MIWLDNMSSSQRTWWWQFIRNSRFCTMNSKQKEERWLEAANYWFPLLKLFIATCCWVLLHIFKLTPHKLQCCYVMYRIIYRSWQLYRDKYHIMETCIVAGLYLVLNWVSLQRPRCFDLLWESFRNSVYTICTESTYTCTCSSVVKLEWMDHFE